MMEKLGPQDSPELSSLKALKKAKSLYSCSFNDGWNEPFGEPDMLQRTGSKLRNTFNAEDFSETHKVEQKHSSFYSFDRAEGHNQIENLRNNDRMLRPTASASHFPGSGPSGMRGNLGNVLSSMSKMSIGSHHTVDSAAYNSVADFDVRRPTMLKTQSMRYPPGFERLDETFPDVDETLAEFEEAHHLHSSDLLGEKESKHLKRFVTFANLKPTHNSSFVLHDDMKMGLDDVSDDEDVIVDVVDDENFIEMDKTPRDAQYKGSFRKLSPENQGPGLSRIDSKQKMRMAFPKTVFDNLDPHEMNPIHPIVKRINSAASIKSQGSLGSSSTAASQLNGGSPNKFNRKNGLTSPQSFHGQSVSPPTPYDVSNGYSPYATGRVEDYYQQEEQSPYGGPSQMPHNYGGNYGDFNMNNMNLDANPQQLLQQTLQNQMLVNLVLRQNALQQNMLNQMSHQQPMYMNGNNMNNGSFAQKGPMGGKKTMNHGVGMNQMNDMSQGNSPVFGDRNISTLLIRHKTTGYRPTLDELLGHVVEFSRDSHGSRLVQCLMESAAAQERATLINEVLPEAVSLMQDLFGNYVMQNFLEHSSVEQRNHFASEIQKSMNLLSFQPHGCRVVQRAIDILDADNRNLLLSEIIFPNEKIIRCAKDPHATHVLQKAVVLLQKELKQGTLPKETLELNAKLLLCIEQALAGEVLQLAVHPHGCRLVQRVLGDCNPHRSSNVAIMLNTIRDVFPMLSVDQHGNFILQHILDNGDISQQEEVQAFVCTKFLELAQHKFGSHLVEKCLNAASQPQADNLVKELVAPALDLRKKRGDRPQFSDKDGDDILLSLMKDPYANFVVQRAFDASQGTARKQLIKEVQDRSEILSRFTYGRHILSHVNRN